MFGSLTDQDPNKALVRATAVVGAASQTKVMTLLGDWRTST